MNHRTAMSTLRALIGLVIALLLMSCGSGGPRSPSASGNGGPLAEAGLSGLDGRQLVEHLDTMAVADRPAGLIASVRSDAVRVSDPAGNEVQVALPKDDFYVSIAPYVGRTHECFFHSLTTCRGELANADVRILVVNDADGAVLVDETKATYDNGFVGLWLPRDITATLTISYDGRSTTGPISTADDAPTCLTTFELA